MIGLRRKPPKSAVTWQGLGTPIGPHDLLIAAICANQFMVITHNTKEFKRVAGY